MVHKVSWLHGNFQDPLENIQSIRKLSRLFGNFPRYPKINFRTIWKISILSGNFPGYSEIFQAIRKLSGPSGKYQEISQAIKKLSRPYRKYLTVRKVSRLSGNFHDHPENIQTIHKLSRSSGNFPDNRETFQMVRKLPRAQRVTCKKFPNVQKLSGRQYRYDDEVFLPLEICFRSILCQMHPNNYAEGFWAPRKYLVLFLCVFLIR